jgi:hypothetical protein
MENVNVYSLNEKKEFINELNAINQKAWPEFMLHWDCSAWSHLFSIFADHQILMTREENLLAYGHTIPISWEDNLINIPDNLKTLIENGVETYEKGLKPNILLALAAVVSPNYKSEGLSYEIVKLMKKLSIDKKYDSLIVPVRPTLKSKYPLIPINNYANWKKEDGIVFDPWLKVHDKLGGKILKTAEKSMIITGKVKEWEEWTKIKMPESGKYIIEGALNPVEVNYDQDIGTYFDPCIWVKY